MADDFAPTLETIEIQRYKNSSGRYEFFPEEGNKIALAYVEVAPGNAVAVNNLFTQIEALCVTFGKKIWTPTAIEGHKPGFVVSATARVDVPE